ncbi:hypothetical protein LY78DRAFT_405285 [Colletotrichum sublineola]|nr:hypothetical protein LY78DRAFT_405285 [Colletotrichum sublineola]
MAWSQLVLPSKSATARKVRTHLLNDTNCNLAVPIVILLLIHYTRSSDKSSRGGDLTSCRCLAERERERETAKCLLRLEGARQEKIQQYGKETLDSAYACRVGRDTLTEVHVVKVSGLRSAIYIFDNRTPSLLSNQPYLAAGRHLSPFGRHDCSHVTTARDRGTDKQASSKHS